MKRRQFIESASAGLLVSELSIRASSQPSKLIRPKALRAGDTVGVITPATPTTDPDTLARAARAIRYFGLKAKIGRHVGHRAGYFGSTPEERVQDLHEMFQDPEVKAVFAMRGGYGAPQLLDLIDYELIRRNPKIFLGYSDITALHLAINRHAGLVTFHGPNVLSDYSDYTRKWFRPAIFENRPLGVMSNPADTDPIRPKHFIRTIRPGRAEGEVIGGNLTLISTLMGTPYQPQFKSKIVLLEDIGEEPYRIDRMLNQLRLAGVFKEAAGVVVGECVDCRPSDFKPSLGSNFSLGEVIDAMLGTLPIPVFYGLTFGHTDDQLTIPLGLRAKMDADNGTLEFPESACL